MGENHIVTMGLDDNYLLPTCVFLWSLRESGKVGEISVVAGYSLSNTSRTSVIFLENFAKQLGINLTTRVFQEGNELSRLQEKYSVTTFARLYLADEIPSSHLWLDGDIILKPGWSDIFKHAAEAVCDGNHLVAATPIEKQMSFVGRNGKIKPSIWMKDGDEEKFANAGVFFWGDGERKKWKSEFGDGEKLGISQDQDLLNFIYLDRLAPISPEYNCPFQEQKVKEAKILHFVGWWKPWKMPSWIREKCEEANCAFEVWYQSERNLLAYLESIDDKGLSSDYLKLKAQNLQNFGGWKTKLLMTVSGWIVKGKVLNILVLRPWKRLMSYFYPEKAYHHFHIANWSQRPIKKP